MADTEMAPADGAAAAAPQEPSQALVVVPGAPQPATSTAIVAAGDVRTAGFDLNEIKKLATQTKAIGVIMPPPDIRAIVDKTASFVAKHGPEFEKRILANERNNAKFNFLVPTDPYHAFYQMRIKHYGSEVEGGDGGAKGKDASAAVEELGKASVPSVQVIPHALAKLEKPEEELYTVHVPQGLSLLELDIIRLAAQFVARNGKSFLTGLASREHTNPLFNFLRPTHSLFGFFTSLCDAYSRVLMPPKDTRDRLARDANDAAALLDRARKRLEWERVKERELQEAADEAEKERVAYQSIDWHDFVVVETIEFDDDEDDELPPPLTLKDVITMNKAREYAELEAQERAEAEKAAQEKAAQGVPMSEEERALIAQAQAVSLNAGQPPAAGGAAVTSAPDTEVQEADMEMDMDEEEPPARPAAPPAPGEEEDEEPIRVVKDYVRPQARMAMYNGQAYDPTKFVVSPITGELVAINDMAEHMRISLIDPRWKEQREAMLSKIRDNTKASDDEIARNLTTLAGTRPDIFGSTEEEVTQVVTESIREKLTSGANRPVAWDGVTQRGPELATQLANIHQNRTQLHHPPPPSAPSAPPGAGLPPPPGAPPVMGAVAAAKLAAQRGPPPPPPTAASLPRPPTLPPPPRAPMPGAVPPIPPPPVLMRPPGPPPMGGGMGGGMPPPPPGMGGGPGGMLPPPPGGMLPPGPPRAPPPPREAPPPMPGDQPEPKRARLDDGFVLQPEEEFLQHYPGPSSVRVQCPEVEGHEKLIGQLLEVQVASLQDTVGEFKERLSGVLALPANKMKLSREGVGFLRDEPTLAHYNVAPAVVLTLGTKERARGKKA